MVARVKQSTGGLCHVLWNAYFYLWLMNKTLSIYIWVFLRQLSVTDLDSDQQQERKINKSSFIPSQLIWSGRNVGCDI